MKNWYEFQLKIILLAHNFINLDFIDLINLFIIQLTYQVEIKPAI